MILRAASLIGRKPPWVFEQAADQDDQYEAEEQAGDLVAVRLCHSQEERIADGQR